MPLYEYGCPSCGQVSDIRHGFDEKPEVRCERCGTPLVRRFSAAPIVFKGSGFYVTDSRPSTKSESTDKPAANADKPADKAEPAKSDGKDSTKKKSDSEAAA